MNERKVDKSEERAGLKVLFLSRSLNYGGAERQLVTLARGLQEKKHSVSVVSFYSGGPLEKDLHEAGVTVTSLNKRGRWDVFLFLWRLVHLVQREKPDILHGYLSVPNLLTILLKPLFPSTRMVWGVRASNMDLSKYDWLARFVFRLECVFSRFANLIIVNSNAGKDYHRKHGFPEDKMVVIPNGIDTDYFKPDKTGRARKRAEWAINETEKVIGLVARLDPMKDHATFLRAATILAQERDDVCFVCVGGGPESYMSAMKMLSSQLGLDRRMIWVDASNDMPAVYNALDIAVSSSSSEGFPNVVGEAMACGVPCVVTGVGDSAWIVGSTGEIVDPGSTEKLELSIERMLENVCARRALKEACRQRVIDHFSLDRLVVSTETVLQGLL
jgi:glycosyltransferase involved in cell wall biosynthesis